MKLLQDGKMIKAMAMETVGYLVLAVIALVILWVFLSNIAPAITSTVKNIVRGIGCEICGIFGWAGWIMSSFCRSCAGLPI